MVWVRGYLTVPEELYRKASVAVSDALDLGLDVYGFHSFSRRKQLANAGFRGFFINGESDKHIDSKDVMRAFYGTSSVEEVVAEYGNPALTFDISSGLEVWPMAIGNNLSHYFAKRFVFMRNEEKLDLIQSVLVQSDSSKVTYRHAELCVVVLESFNNLDLISRISEELPQNYMFWEDTHVKGLKSLR